MEYVVRNDGVADWLYAWKKRQEICGATSNPAANRDHREGDCDGQISDCGSQIADQIHDWVWCAERYSVLLRMALV